MSQSFKKQCRDCDKEILMSQTGGRWAAYELDGKGFHNCRGTAKKAPEPDHSQAAEMLTLESLGIRVKLLEKAVFKEEK